MMKKISYGIYAVLLTLIFAALSLTGCPPESDDDDDPIFTGITLETDSVKKDYLQNETLDLNGLVVTANYSFGSDTVIENYITSPVHGAVLATLGNNIKVTISYTEDGVTQTGDFLVTVTKERTNSGYTKGDAIQLTENIWTDGNIQTSNGVQWFVFTATSSTQYIHFDFGTLRNLSVLVYDSGGTTVGSGTDLSSSGTYASLSLTEGQTYYIRVGSYSGTYRIGFNASTAAPPVQLSSNTITLTENIWADGNLQWFTFTATASTQYIHVDTLADLYVQVYDSGGGAVESETNLYVYGSKYTSRTLTSGQTYYIRVRRSSGTYRIGFNATETAPPVQLPSNTITLTENVWADGNLPTSNDVQWFTFTATSSTQYIHFESGTLTNRYYQVYDNSGGAVEPTYSSWSLTVGQTYYIRVRANGSGTYRITFNASSAAPLEQLPSNAIPLTENVWADGNIPTSSGVQWFTFTAASSTQYIYVEYGTLTRMNVQVYDSGGGAVGSQTNSSYPPTYTLTAGDTYFIMVWPYNESYSNTYSGTYKIGFGSIAPPSAIPLTENVWADGNLPQYGQQWFSFTATSSTQYIHVERGTLTRMYVQVYDSGGYTIGSETDLSGFSRSLTEGQTYYIRVRPNPVYTGGQSGTYRIAFNTSIIPPGDIPLLTENEWADGNLPTYYDVQWFTFTATASTQYIHVEPGTLTVLYVNVYDSDNAVVGSETLLQSSTTSTSRMLTPGQTYYIKVRPYNSNYSGTYRIAFNTSTTAPN